MKISLIHPSRGRPQKSINTTNKWIDNSFEKDEIELIVSVDRDDSSIRDYSNFYKNLLVNDTDNVVAATNLAAKFSKGDILLYLSDDFDCFHGWDVVVKKEFENVTTPQLIKVDDCLQRFGADVLTIPIMNRELYKTLGYFFHPEYKSMFVDQNLYHTVNNMGALKFCPHLKFPHLHYVNGKAQRDEIYDRSTKNWNEGKILYSKHKSQGFPKYIIE